jgi:phosphatidylglycerophosphatase A
MFIATFGFVGYVPFAPGTAGSVAALLPYALLRPLAMDLLYLAAIAAVALVGTWASTAAERVLQRKDPGPVVIDEVLGVLVTLAWLPLSWTGVALGVLLFRLFDVLKPFPAGRFERLPGGTGIMLDDAAAAVYAHVALRVTGVLWPAWILA